MSLNTANFPYKQISLLTGNWVSAYQSEPASLDYVLKAVFHLFEMVQETYRQFDPLLAQFNFVNGYKEKAMQKCCLDFCVKLRK
jgi:hypothetical protein